MLSSLVRFLRPIRYRLHAYTYRRHPASPRLAQLQGAARGSPILIVGNGPSLNATPLDDFAHLPAIGMNKIDLLFPRVRWRPRLIVCVNDIVVMQHHAEFARSNIPVFLSWKSRRRMPRESASKVEYFLTLPTPVFSTDITRGVGFGATVTYTALQFAYFMEADPVILFGVDHNFAVAGTANEIARRKGADVNHFDPNYFRAGSLWGLPDLPGSEAVYVLARRAFEAAGRRVLDATVGGKLDVYPKISLDEAREIAHGA